MRRIWGYVVAVVAVLAAYIFHLLRRNESLETEIAVEKANKEIDKLVNEQEKLKNEAEDAETYYRKVADGYILEQRSKGNNVPGSDSGSGQSDSGEEH